MRHSYLIAWPVLLAVLLGGCLERTAEPTLPGPTVTYNPFASLTPTPFDPPTATGTPSATGAPSPTITPTPEPIERPRYALRAALDYDGHSLEVEQTIVYSNWTGVDLEHLVLAVEPNEWEQCFRLDEISGSGVAGRALDGHRLEVRLDPPLAPGGTVELFLRYGLDLPYADPRQVFGYNADAIALVDWYPFVVPYQGGWLLHEPGLVGEHLVYDQADFDVTLSPTAPDPSLVIAASAPFVDGQARLEAARSFALSISRSYLQASAQAGGVKVYSYHFPGHAAQGQRLLAEVVKAVQTYSQHFGPPPHAHLSIAETDFFDGMEYDGMFFLSRSFYASDDGTVLNYLIDIGVHETAHQWFFGGVGSDQALEPWLDEALATYCERLFYEANYPGVTAWQAFRSDPYQPAGRVDAMIYDFEKGRPYIDAVYLRGASFLHDLRGRIGEAAFFGFLRDYAAEMAGQRATAEDFFRILGRHTQADLTDIIGEYFSRPH
jgi:hypothetical protein